MRSLGDATDNRIEAKSPDVAVDHNLRRTVVLPYRGNAESGCRSMADFAVMAAVVGFKSAPRRHPCMSRRRFLGAAAGAGAATDNLRRRISPLAAASEKSGRTTGPG